MGRRHSIRDGYHEGLPCLDQPGRGQGDLITGGFPIKINSTTGTIYWPNQALEPIYIWNNAGDPVSGWGTPIATTPGEEWWLIGTIIHPPVERRLLPPVRLMDHLARAGEPWPIARPPARLESPTLQPIRDRGTPALQIPTECSKMGGRGFV